MANDLRGRVVLLAKCNLDTPSEEIAAVIETIEPSEYRDYILNAGNASDQPSPL